MSRPCSSAWLNDSGNVISAAVVGAVDGSVSPPVVVSGADPSLAVVPAAAEVAGDVDAGAVTAATVVVADVTVSSSSPPPRVATSTMTPTMATTSTPMIGPHRFSWRLPPPSRAPDALAGCTSTP